MDIQRLIDELQRWQREYGRVMVDATYDGDDYDITVIRPYTLIREGKELQRVAIHLELQ